MTQSRDNRDNFLIYSERLIQQLYAQLQLKQSDIPQSNTPTRSKVSTKKTVQKWEIRSSSDKDCEREIRKLRRLEIEHKKFVNERLKEREQELKQNLEIMNENKSLKMQIQSLHQATGYFEQKNLNDTLQIENTRLNQNISTYQISYDESQAQNALLLQDKEKLLEENKSINQIIQQKRDKVQALEITNQKIEMDCINNQQEAQLYKNKYEEYLKENEQLKKKIQKKEKKVKELKSTLKITEQKLKKATHIQEQEKQEQQKELLFGQIGIDVETGYNKLSHSQKKEKFMLIFRKYVENRQRLEYLQDQIDEYQEQQQEINAFVDNYQKMESMVQSLQDQNSKYQIDNAQLTHQKDELLLQQRNQMAMYSLFIDVLNNLKQGETIQDIDHIHTLLGQPHHIDRDHLNKAQKIVYDFIDDLVGNYARLSKELMQM